MFSNGSGAHYSLILITPFAVVVKKKTGKVGGFAHLLNCDCSRMCRPASRSSAVYSFSFFDILGRFFCHVQTNTTACSFPLILESGICVMFDLNSLHSNSSTSFLDATSFVCHSGWVGVGPHSFVIKKKSKRKNAIGQLHSCCKHWRFVIVSKSRDRKYAVNLLRSCCKCCKL